MCNMHLNIENEELLIPPTVVDNSLIDQRSSSTNRDQFLELFSEIMVSSLAISNSDVLDINQVAQILRCSVDTARRIPLDELPSYEGDGRHHLYFVDELKEYIRLRPRLKKRGSGLSCTDKFIEHTPVENSNNPARRALGEFCGGVQ